MAHKPGGGRPPRLGIVAGPNGSGKSSFYDLVLRPQFPLWVNADEIARTLTHLSEGKRNLAAAGMAEETRRNLLAKQVGFAFETVFSRSDHWLDFLRESKSRGYYLQLFFICTADAVLNAARVQTRVGRGGHSVPLDKVVSRYPGSIRTALLASEIVDELWLYDNTEWGCSPLLLGCWEAQQLTYRTKSVPVWAEAFFR